MPQGGRFDPEAWFRLFAQYRITQLHRPAHHLSDAAGRQRRGQVHDLSSWRHGVSAGEPLPADTLDAIERSFGIGVLDGIGMTECMVYCYNRAGAADPARKLRPARAGHRHRASGRRPAAGAGR